MRDVPPAFQARLDDGATTMARCWKLTLGDGRTRGFTEHDRDLTFGGVAYRAATGVSGSAIEAKTGLAPGDQEIAGILSDEGIDAAELEAGLYDGALVETWLVDWRASEHRLLLSRASIGEVRRGPRAFHAELVGPAARLNAPVGRTVQPACDAVLGDARCGVDLNAAGRAGEAVVTEPGDGRALGVSGLEAFAGDWFAGGAALWLSGANEGLRAELRASGPGRLELWRASPRPIEPGDRLRVTAGCDKSFATCRARFANHLNFRGFPHMPGNDWVTSYPAEGERHDGSSLRT